MIVNEWEPHFTARYGHTFPDTYLCLDTEYTGGDERTDFVMEIGHVMVEDCRVIDQLNIVIDWSVHPGVDEELLRYKLNHIKSIMGRDWRITWDVMKEEGVPPAKALRFYKKFFKAWNARDLPYVAHNGRVAEERMLRGTFNRYLDHAFVIGDNQLWDTGAIFKATALLDSLDPAHDEHRWKCFPRRTDSMKDYFNRVLNVRARGVRWKLKLCLEQYNITGQLQDNHRYHQAVHDAYCSYLLMEAYRKEVTRCNLGKAAEKEQARIFEEQSSGFSEFFTVPEQPLTDKDRETVSGETTTMLPPNPKFTKTDAESSDEQHNSKLEKDTVKPKTQFSRGRKRGQRVV